MRCGEYLSNFNSRAIMEKPTPTTEQGLPENQDALTDRLPIFVKRTTLRAVLNNYEAKKSLNLGKTDGPTSSGTASE